MSYYYSAVVSFMIEAESEVPLEGDALRWKLAERTAEKTASELYEDADFGDIDPYEE